MKLLQIYNQYRSLFGGEETVVLRNAELVEKNGGEARLLMKSSRGLEDSLMGKVRASFSGVFNTFTYRDIKRFVDIYRPDAANVHNLYPLYSPSVLVALRRARIPVVMTVHNHFHTCPTADHFHDGQICERCLGGREYHCVLQDCRGSIPESIAYAARSATARTLRLFLDNVTVVIALNEFAKRRLIGVGFDERRVVVLPNMVDIVEPPANPSQGQFALFAGRMCPEKGVGTLIEAARLMNDVPVRLLGAGPTLEEHRAAAPANATFLGQLPREQVVEAYREARFLVVPSRWFEGCPLVILEAMSCGLPVIASRIGGLPELVIDGVNGLLFEPGNASELADRMQLLWRDPELCQRMGRVGRQIANREHSEAVYWDRLRTVYELAMTLNTMGQ